MDRELPDLEEKVGNSTVELAEKDRETLDLSQQIKHLEVYTLYKYIHKKSNLRQMQNKATEQS